MHALTFLLRLLLTVFIFGFMAAGVAWVTHNVLVGYAGFVGLRDFRLAIKDARPHTEGLLMLVIWSASVLWYCFYSARKGRLIDLSGSTKGADELISALPVMYALSAVVLVVFASPVGFFIAFLLRHWMSESDAVIAGTGVFAGLVIGFILYAIFSKKSDYLKK